MTKGTLLRGSAFARGSRKSGNGSLFWGPAKGWKISQGAPVINTNDMIKVGKALAYLVLDFVKTTKSPPSLEPEAWKRTSP